MSIYKDLWFNFVERTGLLTDLGLTEHREKYPDDDDMIVKEILFNL